jgi:hypothetical protein
MQIPRQKSDLTNLQLPLLQIIEIKGFEADYGDPGFWEISSNAPDIRDCASRSVLWSLFLHPGQAWMAREFKRVSRPEGILMIVYYFFAGPPQQER